jgi:hypothetical protein
MAMGHPETPGCRHRPSCPVTTGLIARPALRSRKFCRPSLSSTTTSPSRVGYGVWRRTLPHCKSEVGLAVTRLTIAAAMARVMPLTILIAQDRHNAYPVGPRRSDLV